jgi:hypothetical protein
VSLRAECVAVEQVGVTRQESAGEGRGGDPELLEADCEMLDKLAG